VTVPITTFGGALAGCVLALIAKRGLLRAYDPIRTRYFVVSILFAIGVVTPLGLGLYLVFPDWSLMYLANPEHLPGWFVLPMLLISYAGGAPVAFLATVRLMHEKAWALRSLVGGLASFLVMTMVLGFDRLGTVAYYDAYHHDLGSLPLSSSALLIPLVIGMGAVGGALYFSLRHIRRHLDQLEDLPAARAETKTVELDNPLGAPTGEVASK
jgi:hypothetical protein